MLAPRFLLASLAATCWIASGAQALSFQVDFRASTYDTQTTDTFSSLLAQHQSEALILSSTVTGYENITNAIYASGVTTNYTMLLTTTLTFAQTGNYKFQVGTDWGRGGAAAVIDSGGGIVSETVYDRDLWWNFNWNDPDVFVTELDAVAGESYTLQWVGFEGCCGGATSLRFAFDDGAYQAVNVANLGAFTSASAPVPEPGTGTTVALGVAAWGAMRRRERRVGRV